MGREAGEAGGPRAAGGERVILGEAIGQTQSTSKRGERRQRRAKGSQQREGESRGERGESGLLHGGLDLP